ncbi:3'a2rel-related protein [Leishmania tarentolae]|uniref:3'a2rel-related protein n=1 Tax=Leishmania tarentolae TaxID=5689 RepID=A0A640KHL1_LEITA|nr:3'a2rel-related protein [Leishmania tarentolae]GET88554.1 3'a2rel-related protein [Leishmania tarentolae]
MPLSALPDSGGAAMQSLQRAAGNEGGSSSVVVSRPNSAFEQILSSAVAPLPVGREFHQRGNDTDGGKVADSATGSEASAAPWPRSRARAERHAGNEGLEEEHAFQADEELDEEYQDEESDNDEGPTQRHRSGAYVPGS